MMNHKIIGEHGKLQLPLKLSISDCKKLSIEPANVKVLNIIEYLLGIQSIANFDVLAIYRQFDKAMTEYEKILTGLSIYEPSTERLGKFLLEDAPSMILYVAPDPSPSGGFLVHPGVFYFDDENNPSINLVALHHPIDVRNEKRLIGITTKDQIENYSIKSSHSVPLACVFHLYQADIPGAAGEHQGQYTIYLHRFHERANTHRPFQYVGITKRGWAARYRQHRNNAHCGSQYLFHKAIRQCTPDKYFATHTVLAAGLTYEKAMADEERLVAEHSLNALHPLGLNMIPGGFAGIRFLGERGFTGITPSQWEHRSALVRSFNAYCERTGKPNLALSLKWTVDDFAARMILSNPNNLNRDQLTRIRTLNNFGMSAKEIATNMQIRNERVSNVLRGATYSRVK